MNNTHPSVYRVELPRSSACTADNQVQAQVHTLYLGEYSTHQGLSLFDGKALFKATEMTDGRIPAAQSLARVRQLQSVEQALQFFQQDENHLEMIDFSCLLDEKIMLSTHDDGECHFEFSDVASLERTLRRAAPPEFAEKLWQLLLANEGQYVAVQSEGAITTHPTFEDYIRAT